MALTTGSFTLSSVYEGTTSETSSNPSLDPSLAAGDWTILACALTGASGSITAPAGWTEILTSTPSTASTSQATAVYARQWVAGDSDPVVNHTSGRFSCVVVRVTGADSTNFLDGVAAATTTAATGATTVVAPSVTPSTTSAVVVTVHAARSNIDGTYFTWTSPTGMTQVGSAGSSYTGSTSGVVVSVVAGTSGTASGTKTATPSAATNGATGVSFVVRNLTTALTHVTATVPSAWNVVGRLTDTQTSAWNVFELAHITATKASAWNVVGRLTDTQTSAWNVRTQVTGTRGSAFNVLSLVGGGAPLGSFMVRLVAYAPNGARLGVLTQPLGASATMPLNDVSGLQFSYSTASPGYQFVKSPCEVALEWSVNGGTWTEAPGGRYLRIKRSDDNTDPLGKVSYDLPGYLWLLGKAKIWPSALDTVDGKRVFNAATPGYILKTLVDEARARGWGSGFGYDFSATLDSNGHTWTSTVNVSYDPGADLLSILTGLADQGVIDFSTQGRTLRVFSEGTYLARDQTVGPGPVTLRVGRDITSAPDTGTLEDVITDLMVLGDNGVKTTLTNPSAVSPWGRWESLVTQSGVTDVPTMATLGQSEIDKGAAERVENTRGLTFGSATFLPFYNYRPGDFVKAPADDGTIQSLRVMAITVSTDGRGIPTGSVTLNDRLLDKQLRDSRRIAGILNGSTAVGGGGTTPAPAPKPDTGTPNAPTGLTSSTTSYQVGDDGRTWGMVTLSWSPVTTNTDGSTMTDFRGYEIWQREYKTGAVWHRRTFIEGTDTTISLGGFDPGSQWQFTVKARDVPGHYSTNALPIPVVTIAGDTTPPGAPSTPVVTPYLGQLLVVWDGKTSAGTAMPLDFRRVEIHASLVSGFTPDATTLKGAMISRAGGQFLLSGLTYGTPYYVRLVAADLTGNASAPSAQGTGTPARISNVDVGDGTINGVKIQPGTITAAMALFQAAAIQRADIALLAVDDARIANLSAGKITTGEIDAATRIIAGTDGVPHAEMRADGFAVVQYDGSGAPYDAIRMGNSTTNFFTIPDPDVPENTLASIDETGMASFQGVDVAGVDTTETGFTIYGQEFTDWMDAKPDGAAAFLYNAGSTTPIDATAEITLAEISFTYNEARNFVVWWNGIHYYSNTSIVSGQIRMIYTNDGSQPTASHGTVAASQFLVPNNTTSIGNFGTSPPLGASGSWGQDGDTIRVIITAHRYYGTGVFNVLTSGSASYQQPYRMWVEDQGPLPANAWVTPGGTSKKTHVATFPATYTRLYTGSGVARSDTYNALQGYISTYGDGRTFIGFADMTSALSGVAAGDILKVEVYLYCHWTAYTTGGTARIGFHGFATSPTTMPSTTVQLSTHFNRPQGRWVSLPLVTPGNWITGTWRGISLGPGGSTSPTYYMRFHGYSDSTYKPAMRITYAK